MRILFIGDIVGSPGLAVVKKVVPRLIEEERLDLVIANAENVSGGSGMLPSAYRQLRQAGVDLITMGDHIYKKMEIASLLREEDRICKPANFPAEAPGPDVITATARDGTPVAVFSLLGRTYMRPVDCPFAAADRILAKLTSPPAGIEGAGNRSSTLSPAAREASASSPLSPAAGGEGPGVRGCVIVDMHAEATADKYLMLHHLKGRVSAVLGTHTHVTTADEQIVPEGTAFISDVGMTGPYDSILGRRVDRVLSTARTFIPSAFDVASGDPRLAAVIVELDPASGRATAIRRVMVAGENAEANRPNMP